MKEAAEMMSKGNNKSDTADKSSGSMKSDGLDLTGDHQLLFDEIHLVSREEGDPVGAPGADGDGSSNPYREVVNGRASLIVEAMTARLEEMMKKSELG